MKILLEVEYDDWNVGAQRIADSLFELWGIEGVEIKDVYE